MTLQEILQDLETRIRRLPAARPYQINVWNQTVLTEPFLVVAPRNQEATTVTQLDNFNSEFEVTIRHSINDYKRFVSNTDMSNAEGLLHQLMTIEPDDYTLDWHFESPRMPAPDLEGKKSVGYQMTTAFTVSHCSDRTIPESEVEPSVPRVETEIVFWDIDNNQPYTEELTIDYAVTGEQGGIHRIELIDGIRPLGVVTNGTFDLVISTAGDEPRLFTIEVDENLEQVEHNGEMRDLWRLHAIFKDDVLDRHTGDDAARTSGFIGVNVIPQTVDGTHYTFRNEAIAWTWRNQNPTGVATQQAIWWDIENDTEFTGNLEIKHRLSGEENGVTEAYLIEGTRALGLLVSGDHDRQFGGANTENQLFALDIAAIAGNAMYEGVEYKLWRVNGIFHEDHTEGDTATGTIEVGFADQEIAGVLYRGRRLSLHWTWANELPSDVTDTQWHVYTYDTGNEYDLSTLEFSVNYSRPPRLRELGLNEAGTIWLQGNIHWYPGEIETAQLDDFLVATPSGGSDRTIDVKFAPFSPMTIVYAEERDHDLSGGDAGEDNWLVFDFAVNWVNLQQLHSEGDVIEGNMILHTPAETIGGVKYTAATVTIPWRLTASSR